MVYRNAAKCSVCGSIKHTKRKCPKLAGEPKTSERIALTSTVASQARTIEGLLHIIVTLGKPLVLETSGRIEMAPPPGFYAAVAEARRAAYDDCIRIVKEHDGSSEDGQYLMNKLEDGFARSAGHMASPSGGSDG